MFSRAIVFENCSVIVRNEQTIVGKKVAYVRVMGGDVDYVQKVFLSDEDGNVMVDNVLSNVMDPQSNYVVTEGNYPKVR